MKRLLSIELQKIWKNRASKVLTITYFGLLATIALIVSIKFNVGFFEINPAEMGIFNFPAIWHFTTYVAVYYKIFLAIIIVSMIGNEYSNGTLKQNLIDGLSKKEFVLSKFLTVVLFAFASTIFIFLMSLILGYSFSSYTEIGIVFSKLEYLLAYFIDLIGFFAFCLFIGILVKRSAFALGFLFLWFCFENLSFAFFKYYLFKGNEMVDTVYNFMPLEAISNLIPEPWNRISLLKNAGDQMGLGEYDLNIHYSNIIIVMCWTAIFIFSSYKILQKRDL